MEKTVLVLGATGGVGGETARALRRHGWRVRALARHPRGGADGFEWRRGDALDVDAVRAAAEGADALLHAVNPPGYRGWHRLVLPMLDNSIAAARAVGARLVLPGTLYNYDPARQHLVAEDAPQRARTRKGAIRVEMERRIEHAAWEGVRALIVRAGDFFGPRPGNSWFSQGMVTPGRPVRSILAPGTKGVGHAWAYLPDLAETFARLMDREAELPRFARYHFAGHWDASGSAMVDAIAAAAGNPDMRRRKMPWGLLPMIAPFNATMREMIEIRPFWHHPLALDNGALVALLGEEPRTPIDRAVREALAGLGCLDAGAVRGALAQQ
ncbi:MAG: NAD-dependent epimerase/dehydratase family protein [Pseudomonadota bacterium]